MESNRLLICLKYPFITDRIKQVAIGIKRLYPIDLEVENFKMTTGLPFKMDDAEHIFVEEIYPRKTDPEQQLYRIFYVDLDSKKDAEDLCRKMDQEGDVAFTRIEQMYAANLVNIDPLVGSQWGLAHTDVINAWTVSQGQNVIVAVVDTGVDYNHPDIKENVWIDSSGNYGRNFIEDNFDPMDDQGHGTHVAGIIAAVTNNGQGIAGVAPHSKIMAIKSLDASGRGGDSSLMLGIVYAVNNGATVINNSWGPTERTQLNPFLTAAINYAYQRGVLVIFAAGNKNDDIEFYSPVNSKQVLPVGSVNEFNERAPDSNYGAGIALYAPGVNILSLQNKTRGYLYMSGTSMSAPFVSGTSAMLLSLNPYLSFASIKATLQANSVPVAGTLPTLNAYKSLTNVSVVTPMLGNTWQLLVGSAVDIGVGPDDTCWVVGTNKQPGGYGIHRFSDGQFHAIPGGAERISVGPYDQPWITNSYKQIFRWIRTGWELMPGSANDIAVGRNGAVWVIGTDQHEGGCGIHHWNGTRFEVVSGSAVRIAVDPNGSPWVVNKRGEISKWTGSNFEKVDGGAIDIAIGADGAVWIIGTTSVSKGNEIYRWNGLKWIKIDGAGTNIAVSTNGLPLVTNQNFEIFRRQE